MLTFIFLILAVIAWSVFVGWIGERNGWPAWAQWVLAILGAVLLGLVV